MSRTERARVIGTSLFWVVAVKLPFGGYGARLGPKRCSGRRGPRTQYRRGIDRRSRRTADRHPDARRLSSLWQTVADAPSRTHPPAARPHLRILTAVGPGRVEANVKGDREK